ncbi:uncharacterized protein HD556DRAFT_1361808 [Suillus plorans]|uniref:Peptidase M20 dimerisation domain-containing protein n=1 Tax=Suillus plorans TaxID=116603 RepID=A0A9P7AVB4_9AGAM|nr:uncharacterized protein HD556DRAFT_1361808 [Suillus plorans]KAG1795949.1 hypothetical protein HD556DRAFT_1361808 [Suillus plorans]
MGNWLNGELNELGIETMLVDLGTHEMQGQTLQLAAAIIGRLGSDPAKKTVLMYGHYDVQPALKTDDWKMDPFTLVVDEDSGRLIGCGSTAGLNVLEAHKNLGIAMPANLRFCFEGMEENGSERLDEEEVKNGKDRWFDGVDCIIKITGPGQDLHSGLFGRTVHEPMTDLIKLVSKLVDHNGDILIPGIDDMVPPHDEEELCVLRLFIEI